MSIVEDARSGVDTVQSGRDYLDTLANKYVMKPKNAQGIGGFVFDYEGETSLHIQAEISDHYAENNTVINDHIAIKPIRLTLHGYVGELVQQFTSGVVGLLNAIQNRLSQVPAYLGRYTPQQLSKIQGAVTQAQSITTQVDTALSRAKNLVGMFPGAQPGQTKQKKAYYKLQGLLVSKQVFIVDTPFGTYNNMVIESLTMTQPEETKYWADIGVVVKQLRFVEVQTSTNANASGRAINQRASPVDQGKPTGQDTNVSVLYQIGHP